MAAVLQEGTPGIDAQAQCLQIETLVHAGIRCQIILRELEQGDSRPRALLRDVDKSPCKLNQTFIEATFGAIAVLQPKLLQHIVRLEVIATIEADEEAPIIGIQPRRGSLGQRGFNAAAFLGHPGAYTSISIRAGVSITSFTLFRNETASRPSTSL